MAEITNLQKLESDTMSAVFQNIDTYINVIRLCVSSKGILEMCRNDDLIKKHLRDLLVNESQTVVDKYNSSIEDLEYFEENGIGGQQANAAEATGNYARAHIDESQERLDRLRGEEEISFDELNQMAKSLHIQDKEYIDALEESLGGWYS